MKLKIKLLLLVLIIAKGLNAQGSWISQGNPFGSVNPANNFLGSALPNNTWIKLGVRSSQDIFIDNNPAQLQVGGPLSGSGTQGGHWIGLGRIFTASIGPFPPLAPKAHLHIHGNNTTNTFGYSAGIRPWFNTGTLYTENSDGMYVGLRQLGLNQSYAVINWSDDAFGGNSTDFLSFNFTGGPNAQSNSVNGQEVGRFSPTGGRGTFGVGNFQFIAPFADPVRRVEILDADPATGTNANAPQLRTTYQYNTNVVAGIFTEFQTTSIGDMYFNTRWNGAGRRFGFHDNTPGNTVEITGQLGVPYFGAGCSGLRFTSLTAFSPTVAQNLPFVNYNRVLTVDGNGDVILIPGALGIANNGLSIVNGSVQLGATCGSGTVALANLLSNRAVPLNGFNFTFSGATGSVGIGTPCVPNNKLEVDKNNGVNPISGLRLTQLAGAPPLPFNNQVLSVNPAGDVILTNIPPPSGFGNLCSAAQNPLTGDFEMPLALNKYLFTGQGIINNTTKQDVVAVGYSCTTLPPSRFSVLEDQTNQSQQVQTYAGHFKNNNQADPTYIATSFIETAGVYGEAKGTATAININNINVGGIFEALNAINTIGVVGRVSKSYVNANPANAPVGLVGNRFAIGGAFMSDSVNNNMTNFSDNYGVYARAIKAQAQNFGVYTETDGSAAQNYALFASAPQNGSSYAGFFSGDCFITGNDNFASDQILKQNIDTIPDALNIINQLHPKTFDYKTSTYPHMHLAGGKQYGLIAQDLVQVLPELVNKTTHPAAAAGSATYAAVTYSTVEYQQLIPILVRAVQQLSAQNHKLDSLITALTQTVSSCCSNSNARSTSITGNTPDALNQFNVDLTDKDVIVLNQNVPNPFAEQTTITYNVPEKYGFAQLIFKTIDGKIIKTLDITKKGRGQVNVFANDLSNGLYMYSLVVDGNSVDTKKMVKQN